MKQPDLGRRIASLRNEKGLTQEELVDKCNINVRTIQRIESGEVTPRPITLRLILDALDYDFEMLNQELNGQVSNQTAGWLKKLLNFFLIDFNPSKDNAKSAKILQYAWIAGLIAFLVGFPESGMEYSQYYHRFDPNLNLVYTLVKIVSFILMVFLLRGFIVLGDLYRNFLLKIASYLLIIHGLFTSLYYIVSVFYPHLQSEHADGGVSITFGILLFLFGISLLRIKPMIGRSAKITGTLAIIASIFFITLILWWVGLLMLIPEEILEIVVLYKGYELIKKDPQPVIS